MKTVRPVGLLSLLSLKMKLTGRVYIAVVLSSLASQLLLAAPIAKPLRVHPTNPRYFTDDGVRAILLTGSHTWNNSVDMGPGDPPPRFDYEAYLKWLTAHSHNFVQLWPWELVSWERNAQAPNRLIRYQAAPQPWQRTGPGDALDGKPRFDLTKFNPDYFARLRGRVQAAQDEGIYASVMLFEGWGIQFAANAWQQHPFHPDNNINGIKGDLDGDGRAVEIHTGRIAEITALQRGYVRHVIETVNGFDNVLYEISNENHPALTAWQYDLIRFIKEQEKTLPKQHPVGMTFQYKGGEPLSVELTAGTYRYDWFDPHKGESLGKGSIRGARGAREFNIPVAGDAVLYLKAER